MLLGQKIGVVISWTRILMAKPLPLYFIAAGALLALVLFTSPGVTGQATTLLNQQMSSGGFGWSNDIRLTFNSVGDAKPRIDYDSSNNLHIAYDNTDNGQTMYMKLDNGGNTLVNEKLLGQIGYAQGRFTIDSIDFIHALTRGGGNNIYYTKLDNSGNVTINETIISSGIYQVIAADKNDYLHILWYTSPLYLVYQKLDSNGQLVAANNLVGEPQRDDPNIAVDSMGNVHVVVGQGLISYMKLDNNGNILVNQQPIGQGGLPEISIDSQDNLHVVWGGPQWAGPFVQYTKLDSNGNTLIQPITFATGYVFAPKLTTDLNDNVHIVWRDSRDGNNEIYYASLDSAGNFLVNETRLTFDTSSSDLPAIAADSMNRLHLVWADNRDGNFEIYYKDTVLNLPPVVSNLPDINLNEDDGFVDNLINLTAYAVDDLLPPESLTYSIKTQSNSSVVTCSIDAQLFLDCNTQANQFGVSNVVIEVSDGFNTGSDTSDVVVSPINDPPIWSNLPNLKLYKNSGYNQNLIDISAYVGDIDNPLSQLVFLIISQSNPEIVSCYISAQNFLGCAVLPAQSGVNTVTVEVSDGSLTAQKTTKVTVLNNTKPVITSTPVISGAANGIYTYDVEAFDAEGDTLVYSTILAPPGMVIDSISGLIEWYPQTTGTFSVTVQAWDQKPGAYALQNFNIVIECIAHPRENVVTCKNQILDKEVL